MVFQFNRNVAGKAGRSDKQQQEQISPNLGSAFKPRPVRVLCQKSEHVYVEGDMTNNETLHAFVDCEKLTNGRNVSEVE